MTDLTDDALDKLVARLTWAAGIDQAEYPFPLCNEATAVITALRQREAEAVAGAIEAAATISQNRWAWCKKRAGFLYEMDYAEAKVDARSVSARGDEADAIAAEIRALHTDATRAALDRVRAEGMREAAAWHEERAKDEDALSSKYRGGSNPWFAHVQMAKIHRDSASAILAAADKLEGKP